LLDQRLAVVRRARALLAFLEKAGLRSHDEDSNPRIEAWMPVVRELTQILNSDFARAGTLGELAEDGESPTSLPLLLCTAKVFRRRGAAKSRLSRHCRARPAPRALGGAEWDSVADRFGAQVERIERGVGRPLAPREPVGHGGNRRGSAKHARATRADALGPTDSDSAARGAIPR